MTRKEIAVTDLEPHPFNLEIFSDEEPSERFVGDIATNGIEEPLKVNPNHRILDGKRRWKAAKLLDYDTVPCDVRDYDDEEEEQIAILSLNDHREETFTQKVKQALTYEEIVTPQYEARINAGQPLPDLEDMTDPPSDLTGGTKRAYAADRVGWSTGKLNQAKQIWRAKTGNPRDVDDDRIVEELQQMAERLVDELDEDNESVYSAYQQLKMKKEQLRTGIPVTWDDLSDAGTDLAILKLNEKFHESTEHFDEQPLDTALEYAEDAWRDIGGEWNVQSGLIWTYLIEKNPTTELQDEGPLPELPARKPDRETLNSLYWKQELGLEDLALRFGVPRSLIKVWMREESVPLRFEEFGQDAQQDLVDIGFVPVGLAVDEDSNIVSGASKSEMR